MLLLISGNLQFCPTRLSLHLNNVYWKLYYFYLIESLSICHVPQTFSLCSHGLVKETSCL